MGRVIVADQNGANEVILEAGEAPSPMPEPNGESRIEVFQTRPGIGGPGRRLLSPFGYDESYEDVEFSCKYVAAAKWTALKLKRAAWPPVPVLLTLELSNGARRYFLALFAQQGMVPTRWTQNGDKLGVRFKFHILEEVFL